MLALVGGEAVFFDLIGEKIMQISIIGSHGVGKTTLMSTITNLLKPYNLSYAAIKEVARFCPLPVGKTSNKISQDWIMNTQRYLEDNCINFNCPLITDRTLIDHYGYYIYWVGENKIIENEIENKYNQYDFIVLMPINPAYLVDDGLRPTNLKFQEDINNIILNIIDRLNIFNRTNVILFNENSVNKIVDYIKHYKPEIFSHKKPAKAEYCYDDKIYRELIEINNLSLVNFPINDFDEIFFKKVISLRQ